MPKNKATGDHQQADLSTLQRYGLRWAVLAAWADDLRNRGATVPDELADRLEATRVKIASRSVACREMHCDLAGIEAVLLPVDSAIEDSSVSFWRELLWRAMDDESGVERLLCLPVVGSHYSGCGIEPRRRQGEA